MLLAGWLMKKRKLSAYFFLMVGSVAMALRLCLYVWFPTKTGLILSQTLHAFCYGAFHPAALNYIASHVRKDRLGAGISLYFSLASGLPSVVGSMVGGHMVDAFGYARMFYTYAAVSLAAVIIGLIFGKFLRSQDKIAFDVI
jgi:PPP family 3-phenylpropionic acid transporter